MWLLIKAIWLLIGLSTIVYIMIRDRINFPQYNYFSKNEIVPTIFLIIVFTILGPISIRITKKITKNTEYS